MDARQRHSKSVLSELHEHAGSLPPSVRPKASKQRHRLLCSAKHPNNQKPVGDFVVCSAKCSAVLPW